MAELTLVYGRYNELDHYGIHGLYKPTYITGGAHPDTLLEFKQRKKRHSMNHKKMAAGSYLATIPTAGFPTGHPRFLSTLTPGLSTHEPSF